MRKHECHGLDREQPFDSWIRPVQQVASDQSAGRHTHRGHGAECHERNELDDEINGEIDAPDGIEPLDISGLRTETAALATISKQICTGSNICNRITCDRQICDTKVSG